MRTFIVNSHVKTRDCDGSQDYQNETIMSEIEFNCYIDANTRYYGTPTKEPSHYENGTTFLTFHSVTDEGYQRLEVDYYEIEEGDSV